MRQPKDYIIFPLDVPTIDEAKRYVGLLSDHVGMFKVGLELFIRSGPEIVRYINKTGAAGVFLDLKLHDIPATVSRAMAGIADLGVKFATVQCGDSQKNA
jgi:orotidine-5'-phosphate decarboxylase